jgi:hypothetical protein
MRYRLRTLLILMAVLPPLVYIAYWRGLENQALEHHAKLISDAKAINWDSDIPDDYGESTILGIATRDVLLVAFFVALGAIAMADVIRRRGRVRG